MMILLFLNTLLFTAPASEASRAETFAAAGEAHLRRAADERSIDAFEEAHKAFDNAYLVADEPRYLCRALAVAERALRSAAFGTDQERLSWEDLRDEDLDRLREDAETTQRSNCRFDMSGQPAAPRVALIDPDGPLPTALPGPRHPEADAASVRTPTTHGVAKAKAPRAARAVTAAGAVFTTAGVGLLGGLVGVAAIEHQRATAMKQLIAAARTEDRYFTAEETQDYRQLTGELRRGLTTAVGVGAASVVSLTTGIVLLATGRRVKAERYALRPYGGLQSAGVVLRLRF